jgi:phosphoglucosamine mutase
MDKYPQCLVNVRLKERVDLERVESVQKVKSDMERELQGQGRILLRASGTEPLVRVMVEGVDPATVQAMADRLADALREVLAA